MDFTFQTAFNITLLVSSGLGGFVLRATWDALREMRNEMAAMRDSHAIERAAIANTYQRRDEADKTSAQTLAMLAEIRHSISTLHDKLDRKADR